MKKAAQIVPEPPPIAKDGPPDVGRETRSGRFNGRADNRGLPSRLADFPPSFSQWEQYEIRHLSRDDIEAHRATLFVPAGTTACTRVDV